MSFKDRTALVTGASTGIGAATALKLSQCGVRVAVNYFKSEAEAKKVMSSIKSHGGSALLVQAVVRDLRQVRDMVAKTVSEFGKIDILVNNAGGLPKRVPILQMDDRFTKLRLSQQPAPDALNPHFSSLRQDQ